MRRRQFLAAALGTIAAQTSVCASGFTLENAGAGNQPFSSSHASTVLPIDALPPMSLGLLIKPSPDPAAAISKVRELGFSNCFLSLDDYLGRYNQSLAKQLSTLLEQNGVTATTVEVVGPGRLVWDFVEGPSTIGVVPRQSRAARIDALKQTSDFAKMLGVPRLQTHCGFIPEDPKEALYEEAVLAIRAVAEHCAANGQDFLMETGQETPTTLSRAIKDVDRPNLCVGLDTANLILYGKANPVDAVDIIGPHVRSVHAKDGLWPTDPMRLGEEVLIGKGRVDFLQVFRKLHALGYRGAITVERETSGPQQIEDVKQEKLYLERILAQVQPGNA